MTLPRHNKFQWNYLLLAFAFPFAGMMMVMLFSQYVPFGDYSMLYSDMYHQYYPFFLAFRDALRSGDSLLYSWNVGMGMDYLGLIAYYLSSPLYLLSVIVPEAWLLAFFSLLVPVKLGFAGLFFAIFLKNIFRTDDLSISIFGTFYALCAWALGYQWNIMWLDTFALLPLVVLGTVRLLRDKKFVLYTFTLFLSVFANYYVGFFICIFVLLLFFVYEICRWQGVKRFFADLGRIACFSLLAIGMTAVLELPAFAALQNTQSSVNTFPEGFKLNIADENTWKGLFDAMRQVAGRMGGGTEPTFKEGLPNLYCGIGTVFLALLYLMAKDVKLRDKICSVVLLVFFMLSFILRQLDYIWHGFHFPNMIPHRFSFLYSIVLLYMAYRAWTLLRTYKQWQMVLAAGLSLAIFACSDLALEFSFDNTDSIVYLACNLILLLLYAAVLFLAAQRAKLPENADERTIQRHEASRNQHCAEAKRYAAAIMAAEIVINLVTFGLSFTGTNISNYPRGTEHTASVIRYMKEREEDTLFYRAETTHSQTLNDGALNRYNGVSTFTSSANVSVTEFMQALGYGAKNTYNRYCYEEASPVSNLFLNLKYMIERDDRDRENAYFTAINNFGSTTLLGNNFYLPLGFLAEPELASLDFADGGGFRFQNDLITAASGVEADVWRIIPVDSIIGTDVTLTETTSNGYCTYTEGLKDSTIVYTYTVDTEGFFCVDLSFPKRNNIQILKNGMEVYSETMSLDQMMAVGDVAPGDVVELRCSCKTAGESGSLTITAAILNEANFRACYEVLNDSTMELITFENTLVEGTIDCGREGLLYTSIPQDGNWSVTVDGDEAEIQLVGGAMIGIPLTEGTHTIQFRYHNAAFSLGWKISLVCAIVFIVLSYMDAQHRAPKGKYARKR